MAELQRLVFEEDGQTYEIYVDSKAKLTTPPSETYRDDRESYAPTLDPKAQMQQARQMMRAYTAYALSAFKDFSEAEIEEVTLKFGLKLGGKAGIPYITEGTAESNLEIQVTCKFSEKQKPSQQ